MEDNYWWQSLDNDEQEQKRVQELIGEQGLQALMQNKASADLKRKFNEIFKSESNNG